MIADINDTGVVELIFSDGEQFNIEVDDGVSLDVGIDESIVVIEGEPYEGEYEATSLVAEDYELETNNKLMTDNVTIKKIPYEAVENPQGGNTVTIGGY